MKKALHAELQKARRRHDLAVLLAVALMAVLWAGSNAPGTADDSAYGYTQFYYAVPVMNAVLMPVAMAALASRIWDVETQGKSCTLLFTLMERRDLFWGKAALGLLENTLLCGVECGVLALLGAVRQFSEPLSPGRFGWLLLCTWWVNAMLYFLLLYFSMRVQSQIAPLALGFCGGLAGLFSAFMPQSLALLVPFGYYVPLGAVELDWNAAARIAHYHWRPYPWLLLAATAMLALLGVLLCRRSMAKKEV